MSTTLAVAALAAAAVASPAAGSEGASRAAAVDVLRLPVSAGANYGWATDVNNKGVIVGAEAINGTLFATKWVPRTEPNGSRGYTIVRAVAGHAIVDAIDDTGRMIVHGVVNGETGFFVVDAQGVARKVVEKGPHETRATTISTSLVAGQWLTDPNIPEVKAWGGLLWRNPAAAPVVIPGLKSVIPAGSNDKGVVVGNVNRGDGQTKAFRYQNGATSFLGSLGGGVSTANAVNEAGTIVGTATDRAGIPKPYVWTGALRALATGGRFLVEPTDINDNGVIVGRDDNGVGLSWSSPSALPMKLPVPPDYYGAPAAINNSGVIAGTVTTYESGYPRSWPAVWSPS